MFSLFTTSEMPPATAARLRRIEQKLDLILKSLGVPFDDASAGLPEEIRHLAESGRKIEAIKLYRAQTGAGLKEAKDAVDAYLAAR